MISSNSGKSQLPSGQTHGEYQSRAWERWAKKAGLPSAWVFTLLLCLWGFRPTSAHVNLTKHREFDCNISVAAPLVLLSRLSVGWMKAWLLGKQALVSFPDESSSCPPYLSLLTLSDQSSLDVRNKPEPPRSRAASQDPRATIYSEAFMLTSVSWSPFSSRVQKVLGPSPSTRVCLQCILFSDSQVAKLCRQKESDVMTVVLR